jgi:hypothetical protein
MNSLTVETKQGMAILDVLTQDVAVGSRATSWHIMNSAQLLDLKIGKGQEAWDKLSPQEMQDNLNAFLFISRAPLETVVCGVRFFCRYCEAHSKDEAWEEFDVKYMSPFMAQISPEAMMEAYGEIEKLAEHVQVVATPPEHQKTERPDPNELSQDTTPVA